MNLKQLPRFFKIIAIVVGSFVALIAAALVAIRSPFFISRILPPIQNTLAQDFNLKTKISGLSIDPFARVALEGVQAEWNDQTLGRVKVEFESVLVRFSFWELLKRNVKVSDIEVISPRLNAELILPETSEKKPPTNPLPLVKTLMLNPPAMVHLNSFAVKNLDVDAVIRQGRLTSRLKLQKMNLSSSVQLENKTLKLGFKFQLGEQGSAPASEGKLLLEAKNVAPALPLVYIESGTAIDLSSDIEFSFADPSNPFLEFNNVSGDVNARKFQFNSKLSKAGAAQLSLDELKLSKRLIKPLRINLAKIFELESLSGEQFQKQVPEKVLLIARDFAASAESTVNLSGFNCSVKLPADGVDVQIGTNAVIPVKVDLTPEEYQIVLLGEGLNLQLHRLELKGAAFQALLKSIKPENLLGMNAKVPLKLRLTPPSLRNLKKPLDGLRLLEFEIEPTLSWKQDREPLLTAKVSAKQKSSGEISVAVTNGLSIQDRLFALLPALKAVNESVGQVQLKNDISVLLTTQWKDLQVASDTLLAGVRNLALDYKVNLNQVALPPKNSPTALNLAGGLQISGRAEVPQPAVLKEVRVSTQVDWSGTPLLKNKLSIFNAPNQLTVSGDSDIFALLRLRQITPLATQMGMLGGTQINAKWKISLPHNAPTILKAQLPPPQLMNVDAGVDAQIQFVEKPVMPLFEKNVLQIAGPLKTKLQSSLRRGRVELKVDYVLPKVGLPAFASVDTLSGQLKVQTKMDLKGGVDLAVQAAIGAINPSKTLGLPEDALPYLNDISAQLAIESDIKSRVDIRQATVTTGKDKFKVNFRGGSDIKATNSRFEGQLAVRPPKVFRYGIRAQDKVALDGVVQVAWELTQKEQKALRLRGDASLENFSAQHQLGGFRNANGRVPFQQDLELPNFKTLKWSYLIQDNPFKRVDASKFVPLLNEDSMLVIEELNALEKKFGPLRGRFSLKQNMLTIDRLDADLFEGVLAGQGFVDIQPSRLLAGLQGRVTKLNTAKLAANPEKAIPSPLSARLAMVVDLSKALVEGRVDVTEIGKNQLLAMTDLLDPSGADPLLNKARLALGVGYPTYVGLQMQQGFLDLDVILGGVVSQEIKIPHLPLTPIINAKTQDLVKTLREVPIQ